MKKNKTEYYTIDTEAFNRLISRVYLSGTITQCVIKFHKGIATVEALDMSNSMSLHIEEKIGDVGDFIEIGLDNLITISKLFSDNRPAKISIDNKKLKIKIDKHAVINISLVDPEVIATSVVDDTTGTRPYHVIKEVVTGDEYSVAITENNAKDFNHYTNLLKNNGVMLKVNKGIVSLTSGPNEPHKFSLQIGKVKNCKNTSIEVYREYFTSIINELNWDNPEIIPEILFTDNENVIIIKQDEKNIWALSPAGVE